MLRKLETSTVDFCLADISIVTPLAKLAEITFPLACPTSMPEQAMAEFIATNLSEESFSHYLSDKENSVTVAISKEDGQLLGYSLLKESPGGYELPEYLQRLPELAAASKVLELSKFYTLPVAHGVGLAAKLMESTLQDVDATGSTLVWLGVNNENGKANRFYEKSGFQIITEREFMVGGVLCTDNVRARIL